MTDASTILDGLNPAQQRAVTAAPGPVLVLAGPGSGKTRVLTCRVAYLIGVHGVDPHHILAVTFTNKAAREMRDRLDALLGPGEAAALTVGTFHSICARFLRRDIVHLGRERDFAIYDTDDQLRVMKRVLRDLNLDERKHAPRAIHAAISRAKNELIDPAAYSRHAQSYFEEVVARCFARYQELLRDAHALDFDDLLVETVRLFDQHPTVLERYQERYRFILADEYQDTNRAQYVLLKQLASRHHNIFVVGDEDQSIYAFRGADIRNILSFERDYPDAQVILLEQNYRSTQAILDVAQAVINRSAQRRREKRLWTRNGKGAKVQVIEGYDQDEEAQLVAGEIVRLIASGAYQPGDIAIMYRTNAQSRAIEEALIARQMPYIIVGGTRFYERKEIKDALAYLRLSLNPFDDVSLSRVLNWPARGIGQRTQEDLERRASVASVPLYVMLQMLAADAEAGDQAASSVRAHADELSSRARNALLGFLALIDEAIDQRRTLPLGALMDWLFERVGFREALRREYGDEEGDDRWNNVMELRTVAENYATLPRESQLPTFLEEVALISDTDTLQEERNAVTCITLHQAKGLEFPVVFLVGLEEGLLPHARSTDDRDALDEERRLFYVGATRAKERLYLLHAFRRAAYGRAEIATPSRFLHDIPPDLLQYAPKRGYAAAQQSSLFTRRAAALRNPGRDHAPPAAMRRSEPDGPRDVSFFAGQRVRHAHFGEGIVVSSKLVEGDEEVTVAFAGKGVKRLLASFANLQRVEE
ncbi:MAG: UvrD-helicase domain-containing protein [Roseiflexus sp.]|nr:UvrD-helicase domain-containing protein [Roseiflexus sp.]MCS7290950.1 UvrD-helicase domain-containing protein [Roseiflexus sp.]MDW8233508.1 UvrD-helicase domain-containing protein [Roseiflexaceae bacterium]